MASLLTYFFICNSDITFADSSLHHNEILSCMILGGKRAGARALRMTVRQQNRCHEALLQHLVLAFSGPSRWKHKKG